jgi:hypothetical protein
MFIGIFWKYTRFGLIYFSLFLVFSRPLRGLELELDLFFPRTDVRGYFQSSPAGT